MWWDFARRILMSQKRKIKFCAQSYAKWYSMKLYMAYPLIYHTFLANRHGHLFSCVLFYFQFVCSIFPMCNFFPYPITLCMSQKSGRLCSLSLCLPPPCPCSALKECAVDKWCCLMIFSCLIWNGDNDTFLTWWLEWSYENNDRGAIYWIMCFTCIIPFNLSHFNLF